MTNCTSTTQIKHDVENVRELFIYLHQSPCPGQGRGGSRAFLGNTGNQAGKHHEWDTHSFKHRAI